MDNNIIPLGFLVLSTGFVITLIRSLIKLLQKDWGEEGFNGKGLLKVFIWPLIFFLLFVLFIIYVVPPSQ